MRVLRYVAFIPVLLVVNYLVLTIANELFIVFSGVNMLNNVTITATVIKCLLFMFCGFLGVTLSALVYPGNKSKVAIITTISLSLIIFVTVLSFDYGDPLAWRYGPIYVFHIIGYIIAVMVIHRSNRKNEITA